MYLNVASYLHASPLRKNNILYETNAYFYRLQLRHSPTEID